jgi:hypothetical protein
MMTTLANTENYQHQSGGFGCLLRSCILVVKPVRENANAFSAETPVRKLQARGNRAALYFQGVQ